MKLDTCPASTEEWQREFEQLKASTKQSKAKQMEIPIALDMINEEAVNNYFHYHEESYEMYCTFINDVLYFIRDGEDDFVFYPYQIVDLLHFEHDGLCSEYLPDAQCFRVWLRKKED